MKDFSLTVTNDLGTFCFNSEILEALKNFLIFSFPLVNEEFLKDCDSDVKLYHEEIKSILPMLRVLYNVLHHDL